METKHTYKHKKNIKINMVLLDSPIIREIIMLNFDKLYSMSKVHRKGRLMLYSKIARENYSGRNYLHGGDVADLMEILGYDIEVSYEIKVRGIK